ncbi:MAG: ABC transporter ATP-binding protein [Solirubrobacterales bacterium]
MTAGRSGGGDALVATGVALRRGGREVVADVDLRLRGGEVAVLLGPNGAGKSTLLSGLAGLERLAAGTVEVAGRLAAAAQAPALAQRSVRANVELGLAWWGAPRACRRGRAMEALELLGVAHLAAQQAQTLSGGEARRVHLARSLAVRPDVLLLDEPFAGLDPTARADLLYDVAGVVRDPQRATLIVVHDRSEAWALADRVLVLLDGRIAADGPPAAVLDHPTSADLARFLGFSGEIVDRDGILLTRPGQVLLDPAGPLPGRVVRKLPTEDGARLELDVEGGSLVASCPAPGPEVGEGVRVRIAGGVRFEGPGVAPGSSADGFSSRERPSPTSP